MGLACAGEPRSRVSVCQGQPWSLGVWGWRRNDGRVKGEGHRAHRCQPVVARPSGLAFAPRNGADERAPVAARRECPGPIFCDGSTPTLLCISSDEFPLTLVILCLKRCFMHGPAGMTRTRTRTRTHTRTRTRTAAGHGTAAECGAKAMYHGGSRGIYEDATMQRDATGGFDQDAYPQCVRPARGCCWCWYRG